MATPIYKGFDAFVTDAADPVNVKFQNTYDGLEYTVNWPNTQTAGDKNKPVHTDEPATLPRRTGASGRLFLKDGQAKNLAGAVVSVPGAKVLFAQEAHRVYSVRAGTAGGQYSRVTLRYNNISYAINFADPLAAWLGAPSTLTVDANGFPVAGSTGNLAISQTFITANGLAATAGNKWPDSLATSVFRGHITVDGEKYSRVHLARVPGSATLVDFWLNPTQCAKAPEELYPGMMEAGTVVVLPDGYTFDPPDPGKAYILDAWLKTHLQNY